MTTLARLGATRLFAGLDAATLAPIASRTGLGRFDAREALFHAGDAPTRLYVVQRGLVEVVDPGPGEHPTIVGLFGPREAIGLPAVLEKSAYPADAVAASAAVEALAIDAATLLEQADRRPEVARALSRELVEHTHALRAKIRILAAGSVGARLAQLFLHLAERFGDEVDGTTVIPVQLPRAALAAFVSARVETVIRQLGAWQKRGWVRTTHDGFEIDREALGRVEVEG